MGKPTGFMEFGRSLPRRAAGVGARARLARGVRALRRGGHQGAGGTLHGLRHPLLPRRLPVGEPDPGMERSGLPGRLARGHGAAARDQQLPGVHRAAVPGPVRGLVRARDQRGPGDHRTHRVRNRGTGVGRGVGHPAHRDRAHRQDGGRGGLGAGGAGGGAAAGAGGAHGDGVRAGREARWAAALRDPRVQDGEGRAGSPAGPDGGGGCHLRVLDVGGRPGGSGRRRPAGAGGGAGAGHRQRARRGGAGGGRRAGRVRCAWCWPAGPPCRGTYRYPGESWPVCTWLSNT